MWAGERYHSQRVVAAAAAVVVLRLNFSSVPHLMSLHVSVSSHVCVPPQYVRTRQSGICSGTICQLQKTLWGINQGERRSEPPVYFPLALYGPSNTLSFFFFFFLSCPARLGGHETKYLSVGSEFVWLEEGWELGQRMEWCLGLSVWMHAETPFPTPPPPPPPTIVWLVLNE